MALILVVVVCGVAEARPHRVVNNYYSTTNNVTNVTQGPDEMRSDYEAFDYGAKLELPLYVAPSGMEVRVDPQYMFETKETAVMAVVRLPINKIWQK